ncbi:MAG: glycosyltransferase family 4 protein [Candidatus Taylorbacteria bacterium]|nr:glycosyltransferase family 4 protein [Candidatus Taylorbacteria bacterium]
MRIGFYFECLKSSGGVYQYALNLLDALRENREHDFVVFTVSSDFPFADFNLPNWKIINLMRRGGAAETKTGPAKKETAERRLSVFIRGMLQKLRLYRLEIFLTTWRAKKRAQAVMKENPDLIFFHGPSELSFLNPIPAVVPIQDLQHLINPRFPEVSKLGQRQKRQYLYQRIKNRAYRILVDSPIGKEDITRYYGVSPEKIIILPPLPPKYLKTNLSVQKAKQIAAKFSLPEKFLFYPAQFWPHKNHLNLLKAVKLLRDRDEIAPLALAGSKRGLWGTYDKVLQYIKQNNLEPQVYLLGYVDNEEMGALYRLATGFIMPTYFGWTNIPLVEAWQMNCPAIYSNVRGCKEQAGDAALLINPKSPEDMAEKIHLLWNNAELRKKLVLNGQKRLSLWTKDDYNATIMRIIEERQKSLLKNIQKPQ